MGWIARTQLASAVSRAGGLGIIETSSGETYFGGDMEAAPALTGQSAGLIDAIKPAREIIEETVAQFSAITGRLGSPASAGSFG
jgi:NAD(P)H-dependent flavin oxidoreductase YrpB (nitropropane dioxygenase family)